MIITQFSAKEAVLLASAILKNPDALDKHFQRSSASAIMSIYDYPTLKNEHDETITQIHAFIDRMTRISQHHSSGSFYSGDNGVLQDLMSKACIRGNLTGFVAGIAVVRQTGLTYVLGETNSFSCHGAPGVSHTAGAALWAWITPCLQASSALLGYISIRHRL